MARTVLLLVNTASPSTVFGVGIVSARDCLAKQPAKLAHGDRPVVPEAFA